MPTLSELLAQLTTHPGLKRTPFRTGVQASPPGGSYVGVASGVDATRRIVSSDLVDLDVSGEGSDTRADWHGNAYCWLPSLNLQRRVATDGYSPAEDADASTDQTTSDERVGVLTLTRGLGSAIAANLAAELHRPFPPMEAQDGKPSLRSFLNGGLVAMRFRVRLTLTGVSGARRYSLAAHPWLFDETDLIAVYDAAYADDVDPDPMVGESYLRFDAGTPYLVTGVAISGGAAFSADFYRRRQSWIAVTGKATATVLGGAVTGFSVTRGGSYTVPPTVTITGVGTGATATAVLTNGTVSSITVLIPGTGYTVPPTVTLSAGEFASSTVGLANPDDVATGPLEATAAVAYALLCDEMSLREGEGTDGAWEKRRQQVEELVAPYLRWGQARQRRPVPVAGSLIRRGQAATSRTRWA